MAYRFNTKEIIEVAVKIEKNGVEFYAKASELSEQPKIKKLFMDLSLWEKTHVKQFSEILNKYFNEDNETEWFDPEAEATKYLEAIANGQIFVVHNLEDELQALSEDARHAINMAIQREKDAIVFYSAILDSLYDTFPADDLKTIIQEEYSHVRYLSEMLSEL